MLETSPFFRFVVLVLKCKSIEEVWTLLLDAMGEAGFVRLLYVSTRFLDDEAQEIDADALVLTNHHQDVLDVFLANKYYQHSPTGAWGKEGVDPVISWRRVEDRYRENDLSKVEEAMRELAHKHHVIVGYTVTLENADPQSRAVIGLCARRGLSQDEVDALWQEREDEFLALLNLAHLKISSLPQTGQRRPLTSRQIEVLSMVSEGQTAPQIAEALGLTVSAVEKNLRLARAALGVRTTVEAVRRATVFHLLTSSRKGPAG